ncbi:BLUF domain-containing protein [Actinoplanes sp. NPDC051859]|uniref:BLUF domain-containing protein n=1 Tax=Actinoplanes sp. NPDC051859 TaxID=3363909 RepID=UPI003798068C
MILSRLLYASVKNPLPSGEIFDIHLQAQRNNARDGLTGVLLFNRSYFVQLLEGERVTVTAAFARIAADERHKDVCLLRVDDITERDYPDWSMGLLDAASPSVQAVLKEASPDREFTPATLAGDTALAMMRRLQSVPMAR